MQESKKPALEESFFSKSSPSPSTLEELFQDQIKHYRGPTQLLTFMAYLAFIGGLLGGVSLMVFDMSAGVVLLSLSLLGCPFLIVISCIAENIAAIRARIEKIQS